MEGLFDLDHGESPAKLIQTAPPFVGRQQELALLERTLQEMAGGRPRVTLIVGDAGIGKTRLLQEVRSMAVRYGAQIGYGRCYEDLALPYLPFVEALHPLLDQNREETGHTLNLDAEALGQLFHQAQLPSAAAALSIAVQADQDKLRLLLGVSGTILKLAQRCPTLFIVDDLHWADQPSLELFGYLAFTLAEAAVRGQVPLLILGAYRPVEPEERLARLIARLQREPICQTFTISGLSETEIKSLIQGLGQARPSHQLTAAVSVATQGNPLFVQEVLHHHSVAGLTPGWPRCRRAPSGHRLLSSPMPA
jgi:predicted ATPase